MAIILRDKITVKELFLKQDSCKLFRFKKLKPSKMVSM